MRIVGSIRELTGYNRFGVLLIIIGLMYAIDHFTHTSLVFRLWPLLLIIMGAGFTGIFIKRDRRDAHYIVIAVYLLCFGGLAIGCNFTSWAILAKLWPLFIVFLGLSLVSVRLFCARPSRGSLLMGLLLISLAGVFFFVFNLGSQWWWTVLILAGLSILVSEWTK